MAWHRKHRPQLVSELHLASVRTALEKLMASKNFPQVFLFAGPKGTGKTSTSRILGAMLNDPLNADVVDAFFFKKPLKKARSLQNPDIKSDFSRRVYEGNSFVVQEMDAASNRGIDDIRALKERVMLPPQEGKVTVYILDEAHMLTTEAFNALLKLLEEPPAHAVFILATTELHKIPETIISSSYQINFHKASNEELTLALESVLAKEKIKAEPLALQAIVARADGSFRDGVKLLESVIDGDNLTLLQVENNLGKNIKPLLLDLIQAVLDKDSAQVSQIIASFRTNNVAEKYLYTSLFSLLHSSLMKSMGVETGEPVYAQKITKFLLQELLQAQLDLFSPIPFLPLELKLLDLIDRAQQKAGSNQASGPVTKKKILKTNPVAIVEDRVEELAKVDISTAINTAIEEVAEVEEEEVVQLTEEIKGLGQTLLSQWDQFLKMVQLKNATVAALLRSSKPSINETGMPEVAVFYKFHQEQLQQQKYMDLLLDCARDLVGSSLPLRVALQKAPATATLVEIEQVPPRLSQLAEEALL